MLPHCAEPTGPAQSLGEGSAPGGSQDLLSEPGKGMFRGLMHTDCETMIKRFELLSNDLLAMEFLYNRVAFDGSNRKVLRGFRRRAVLEARSEYTVVFIQKQIENNESSLNASCNAIPRRIAK